MDKAFIKTEIVFRNFVRRQFLVTWGFLALCFGLLTWCHTNLSSSQFIRTVKTTGCQWITLEWWIVRMPQGDRAVIYRFGEHGKMADGWKPATICYTRIRKTFSVWEVEVGEVGAVTFLGLVLGNHLLQQLIQIILVLQQVLPQNGQMKKWGSKATSKKPRIKQNFRKKSL